MNKSKRSSYTEGSFLAQLIHKWYPFIPKEQFLDFYADAIIGTSRAVGAAAVALWVQRRVLAHEAQLALDARCGVTEGVQTTERCRHCGLEWSCPECDGKGKKE
jgi:hypothetical protein